MRFIRVFQTDFFNQPPRKSATGFGGNKGFHRTGFHSFFRLFHSGFLYENPPVFTIKTGCFSELLLRAKPLILLESFVFSPRISGCYLCALSRSDSVRN